MAVGDLKLTSCMYISTRRFASCGSPHWFARVHPGATWRPVVMCWGFVLLQFAACVSQGSPGVALLLVVCCVRSHNSLWLLLGFEGWFSQVFHIFILVFAGAPQPLPVHVIVIGHSILFWEKKRATS